VASRCARLLFLFFVFVRSASAWGPEGHRMVGDIAQGLLSDRAAREVAWLLGNDRLADRTPSGRANLGEIANWADEIRDQPWSKKYSQWHYDNLPLCEEAPREKVCPRGNCASGRLAQQLDILKDRARPRRDRNEALKWIVHLAGDIHQPLHAADHHDRGGNTVAVVFFGQTEGRRGPLNLHTIWDEQLVERLIAERGGESAIASAPLSVADRAAWAAGTIDAWMRESNALARSTVYGNIPGFSCGARAAQPVEIGAGYTAAAAPVIERQIRKAGVRLAALLNEALDGR
jgi:S1/P1 Nuclease